MTSLQLFLARHELRREAVARREIAVAQPEEPPHRVAANRSFMMKVVLLGTVMMSGGFLTAAAATPDPAFQTFAECVGGGVLGMIAGLSAWRPKDVQAMSQEIAGNLACAIAFGPAATYFAAARVSAEPNVYWFVAVSAILGITGLAIVKACRTEFVAWVMTQMGFKKPTSDNQPGN